jgi:hypothetical protein
VDETQVALSPIHLVTTTLSKPGFVAQNASHPPLFSLSLHIFKPEVRETPLQIWG